MTSYEQGGMWQQGQMGGRFWMQEEKGENEDWYQSGFSVWVKEVSRLVVAFCGSCLSLRSELCLCVQIHTRLNTPPLLKGFIGERCMRLERDGLS